MLDKFLALDVETSGLNFDTDDPSVNYQVVSIGLIVSDGDFNPIDEFYTEIKWNKTSHWNNKAESIHGLSKEYLEQNGVHEGEAAVSITEFMLKHFEPDEKIILLGHNVRSFDFYFFNKLMRKFDFFFQFSHRVVDTFPLGLIMFGAENSDELFDIFFPSRKTHNALQDAKMTLTVCKKIKTIMESI